VHFDQFIGASENDSIVIDQLGTKWLTGTYDRQLVRLDDGGTPFSRDDDAWQFYRYPTTFSPNGLGVDAGGNVWLGRYGETLAFSDRGTPEERADDVWRPVSELGPARHGAALGFRRPRWRGQAPHRGAHERRARRHGPDRRVRSQRHSGRRLGRRRDHDRLESTGDRPEHDHRFARGALARDRNGERWGQSVPLGSPGNASLRR
jgi:hypothetical protein